MCLKDENPENAAPVNTFKRAAMIYLLFCAVTLILLLSYTHNKRTSGFPEVKEQLKEKDSTILALTIVYPISEPLSRFAK